MPPLLHHEAFSNQGNIKFSEDRTNLFAFPTVTVLISSQKSHTRKVLKVTVEVPVGEVSVGYSAKPVRDGPGRLRAELGARARRNSRRDIYPA